jgi:hypothetical protein
VGALLTRRVRKDQPQQFAEIDLGSSLAKNIAFLVNASTDDSIYDLIGRRSLQSSQIPKKVSGVAGQAFTNLQANKGTYLNGVTSLLTSDGAFTGEFSVSVYANPSSIAAAQIVYGPMGGAAPESYFQFNGTLASSAQAGSVAFITPGGTGVIATGNIDGNFHLYTAVRRANNSLEMWVDSTLVATSSFTGAIATAARIDILYGYYLGNYGCTFQTPLVFGHNRALLPSEITALADNPWQLFKPKSRRMFAGIASAGNTAVNPGAGTLVITGAAPTVSQSVNQQVNPGAGSLAFTGYAPVIQQPQSITAGTGALVLTGYAPAVTQLAGIAVNPGAGALTLTGYAPAIAQPRAIAPSAGSLVLTGYAPSITQAVNQQINPAVGNLALTGYAPTLTQSANTQLSPAAGALAILGFAPSISQIVASPNLVPGVGTLTLTGFAPTVGQTNIIAPRYAKPNADTVTGAWVPSTGSSLYAMINETVEDDTTFIKATTATTCDVALNPVANPGTTSGQVVRYSAWSPFGNGLTVSLKQGATVIASWTTAVLPVAPTLFEQNLTAAQIAAISDYGALHLSFASQ